MNLSDFIRRLQKLHSEEGDAPVVILSPDGENREPAEPQIMAAVDNGTLLWREAGNDDPDENIVRVIEIV